MSFEEVHVQLREHDGNDGESFKIVKEVVDNVDPDTKNVVYFMENVEEGNEFQQQLESANRGEISYREAAIKTAHPELASMTDTNSPYNLAQQLSSKNWGKMISDFGFLLNSIVPDGTINWETIRFLKEKSEINYNSSRFMYSRAAEYDKLKEVLKQRGRNFIVISENSPKVYDDIEELFTEPQHIVDIVNEHYPLTDEIDNDIFIGIYFNTKLSLLSIVRDENNAKMLRERITKIPGKTEIFTHFGTMHKYFPEQLEKNGFKSDTVHGPAESYAESVQNDIVRFVKESDRKSIELSKDDGFVVNLAAYLFEKYRYEYYLTAFVGAKEHDYRKRISEYEIYNNALKNEPLETRTHMVKGWLHYYLDNYRDEMDKLLVERASTAFDF